MNKPIEHTYWGFTPEYLREPEHEGDPILWFNTLKEAQEYRGNHNLLAKLAKDDLILWRLPVDASDLVDSPAFSSELIEEWDKATLKLAKKLGVIEPDFTGSPADHIPKHVGSEFRSKHVNFTVDAIRELL